MLQLAELLPLLVDALRYLLLCRPAAARRKSFLRKQLALYQGRHIKPRRATIPPASSCVARALVRLASGVGHCTTRHLCPLASRLSNLLAREIHR
jgi:hypothetical protein